MGKYSIGLDFGTNSCRALIVDISNGQELASHVFEYPSGDYWRTTVVGGIETVEPREVTLNSLNTIPAHRSASVSTS